MTFYDVSSNICQVLLFGLLFFCPMCILFGPRYAGSTWKARERTLNFVFQ